MSKADTVSSNYGNDMRVNPVLTNEKREGNSRKESQDTGNPRMAVIIQVVQALQKADEAEPTCPDNNNPPKERKRVASQSIARSSSRPKFHHSPETSAVASVGRVGAEDVRISNAPHGHERSDDSLSVQSSDDETNPIYRTSGGVGDSCASNQYEDGNGRTVLVGNEARIGESHEEHYQKNGEQSDASNYRGTSTTEHNGEEEFSDLENADAVSTVSIESNNPIRRINLENGRGYHNYKGAVHYGPNDEVEEQRLDKQHALYRESHGGKNFLAPVDEINLHRVLDVGTGTGIWALDFADEHPQCTVWGVDLSLIQTNWPAQNVKFEIDDLEQEWTFKDYKFDYIHCRDGILPLMSRGNFYKQAYDNLNPGGYLEVSYLEIPLWHVGTPAPYTSQWCELMIEGKRKAGYSEQPARTAMEQTNFIDVSEHVEHWPASEYHKQWADTEKRTALARTSFLVMGSVESLTSMSSALLHRELGMDFSEINSLIANVAKEQNRADNQAVWTVRTVYGQKPMEAH